MLTIHQNTKQLPTITGSMLGSLGPGRIIIREKRMCMKQAHMKYKDITMIL